MDGSLGPSAQSVSDVSKNIDQNIEVDVCLWDERLSTVGAFNLSGQLDVCLLYTSPSPRDAHESRMPSSA